MHNWIVNLGYSILRLFTERSANMGAALKIVGVGMLGIFVVMGAIILTVQILNKLGSRK